MTKKTPEELQSILSNAILKLQTESRSISAQDLTLIGKELSEVAEHVSPLLLDRGSLSYAIRCEQAEKARIREHYQSEQKNLLNHQEFVQSYFDKANAHLRTFQLAGFATFFAILVPAKAWLTGEASIWSILLMMISAIVFVAWEIIKATLLSFSFGRHAKTSMSGFEAFLRRRTKYFHQESTTIAWLGSCRWVAWTLCVIPTALAYGILIYGVVTHYIDLLSKSS